MYCTMRRQYLTLFRMNDFIMNKEKETRRKIQSMAEKAAKKGHYKTVRKAFIQTASPFVSLMVIRMTIKLWRKYNKQHKEKVEEHASRGIMNYESSREEDQQIKVDNKTVRVSTSRSPRKDSKLNVADSRLSPSMANESAKESFHGQNSSLSNSKRSGSRINSFVRK